MRDNKVSCVHFTKLKRIHFLRPSLQAESLQAADGVLSVFTYSGTQVFKKNKERQKNNRKEKRQQERKKRRKERKEEKEGEKEKTRSKQT